MTWVWALLTALALIGLWVFLRKRRPRLTLASRMRVLRQWSTISTLSDPHRQVTEADALLDAVLKELGFTGTLGDKLRSAQSLLGDQNRVWSAHKLRNRLVHEPGVTVPDGELRRAMKTFETTILRLSR